MLLRALEHIFLKIYCEIITRALGQNLCRMLNIGQVNKYIDEHGNGTIDKRGGQKTET